ncbi:unnamed protein product [Owenia fusiformis]|uniref:C3H1-type domain-containing protein n=1 Tax=Owenia fusiformis TaxID=6347 RepID=A0A8S4Q6G3_OWEFU|nr:unnamed protein product [Owenia fusiformis]
MGKRYYCELCDKSFAGNLTNRKNHAKGFLHQKLRQEHYNTFKDPSVILTEQLSKKPCRKIQVGEECEFGDHCRFSHLTPDRKQQLENLIVAQNKKRLEDNAPLPDANIDEWLEKRNNRLKKGDDSDKTTADEEKTTLPEALANIPNLPPSLIPPSKQILRRTKGSDWG